MRSLGGFIEFCGWLGVCGAVIVAASQPDDDRSRYRGSAGWSSPAPWACVGVDEESCRLDAQAAAQPLDGAQRQVALTPLDRPHEGPVDVKNVGELLLGKATFFTDAANAAPEVLLELAFHAGDAASPAT